MTAGGTVNGHPGRAVISTGLIEDTTDCFGVLPTGTTALTRAKTQAMKLLVRGDALPPVRVAQTRG